MESKKFNIPLGTSDYRAREMVVEQINYLIDRLEKLETLAKTPTIRIPSGVSYICTCNADYTGLPHSKQCGLYESSRR